MGVDILMEEGAEERAEREREMSVLNLGFFFSCLSREQGIAEHTSAAQYNTPVLLQPPKPQYG